MTDSRCEELLRLSSATFERFRPWMQLNQDIAENFYAERADFTTTLNLSDFGNTAMEGSPFLAREQLGNAIEAMLRQGDWFKLGTGNKERDARTANAVSLKRGSSAIYSIIRHPKSNWMPATKEADMDWVAFGAHVMSVEESVDRARIVYKPWHLRDCAWELDDDRRPYCIYRDMLMSARNIKEKFDNGRWSGSLSPSISRAALFEPGREFKIRHILMPADSVYGGSAADLRRLRHKFISIYIDVENRAYLNEAGSPVFNYVIARNRTLSGYPFGFSPMALNSLPDARMIQDMALVILEQGQKAVDPPTITADSIFTRDMQFFAGGNTAVDLPEGSKLKDVFTTIETGQIGVGLELKADVRTLIQEAWLLNKLMLPTLRDMRELEVQVRTDEFRRAALPFFQPIESNYHGELLGVTYDVAANMGIINPAMFTQELRGQGVAFTFDSPLNEAEGTEIVRAYYEAVNVVATGAKIDKTVANIFDLRTATEDALAKGLDPRWVIPEDQRQQADQQADVVGGLTQAAEIARNAAGVTADVSNAALAARNAGLAAPQGA